MFHIIFSSDENYIKYTAVLINSIIKNTNINLSFKDICKNSGFDAPKDSSFSSYRAINFDNLSSEQKQEGYIFHILSDNISSQTQNKLNSLQNELNQIYPCQILTHIIDDKEFSSFPISGAAHSNFLTYYRLKLESYQIGRAHV